VLEAWLPKEPDVFVGIDPKELRMKHTRIETLKAPLL
jgi:hypothetical protein